MIDENNIHVNSLNTINVWRLVKMISKKKETKIIRFTLESHHLPLIQAITIV